MKKGEREEEGNLQTCDIQSPDGTSVSVVRAKELAVGVEPDIGGLVLGRGEEEVTVVVEPDHGEGPGVALQKNWALEEKKERERKKMRRTKVRRSFGECNAQMQMHQGLMGMLGCEILGEFDCNLM